MLGHLTQSDSSKENVIFLHFHKTPGTIINFILARQYDSEIIHTIDSKTTRLKAQLGKHRRVRM